MKQKKQPKYKSITEWLFAKKKAIDIIQRYKLDEEREILWNIRVIETLVDKYHYEPSRLSIRRFFGLYETKEEAKWRLIERLIREARRS